MRPMRTFAAVLFTALSFTVFLESQTAQRQDPTHPKKVLTPEQQEYQRRRNEYMQKRQSLQREAKRVFETEMAREKAGDCPEARTTYDFNVCFGKQVTITDQNLKSYEDVIRQLVAGPPQAPGNQTPTAGIAVPCSRPSS